MEEFEQNGDVFIFDLGQHIVVWNGPDSNRIERMKVQSLKDFQTSRIWVSK